ncbi:3-oxoacyl-[acyl-carrier protein] reductase [Lishizhenia tianjinensis]|uniref:3-oxoacyl-[acyl-carrier protein] reductase n=1 Tax=Lishizhenia tianjinensis TaxID=477690 RepID=A0A1I6Y9I9_9FLAO|nr:SDR family oxidoreductase [Lishizhenia tianjinensis]SFT47136.1 3-oxoacyl-[acyl-carrier protein] reductase [Lishizhenia tianjinensis]
MDLTTAKVIITGGTSGIGYAMAKDLKAKGAQVLISGRDQIKIDATIKELGVLGFKADMKSEDEIKALINYAKEKMGGFNVLINNAGMGIFSELTETSTEDFKEVWEVNTLGLFIAGREAAKHFKEQQYGNIINISSSSGVKGHAKGSAYCASKFAVSGLTDVWRAELRPFNVRVMQINPSEVVTEFFSKMGMEQKVDDNKLRASEIAHVATSMLAMNDVGFITDAAVWATNPWK